MSVCFFGADALAEVAIVAAAGDARRFGVLCDELPAYSRGNAAAFRRTYPRHAGEAVEVTAGAIRAAARAAGGADVAGAFSTAELLSYNLVANDGTDCGDAAAHAAIGYALGCLLRIARTRLAGCEYPAPGALGRVACPAGATNGRKPSAARAALRVVEDLEF